MFLQAHGGRFELRTRSFTIDDQMKARLERTLEVVPGDHLRYLQYIEIRDREDYAGGSTNPARDTWPTTEPGIRNYWIMLDIDSFDPNQRAINNQPNGLHYTLLHELGHVADSTTRSFEWIRRHDREGYHILISRSHSGRFTTGDREKFADTYADLFFYPRGNRQRDRCIEVILNSPAFTRLPRFVRLPNGWRIPYVDNREERVF